MAGPPRADRRDALGSCQRCFVEGPAREGIRPVADDLLPLQQMAQRRSLATHTRSAPVPAVTPPNLASRRKCRCRTSTLSQRHRSTELSCRGQTFCSVIRLNTSRHGFFSPLSSMSMPMTFLTLPLSILRSLLTGVGSSAYAPLPQPTSRTTDSASTRPLTRR